MGIKSNYITSISKINDSDATDSYKIDRDPKFVKKPGCAARTLNAFEKDIQANTSVGKAIKTGIAAQEIYKGYIEKSNSLCGKFCYVIKKAAYVIKKIFYGSLPEFGLDAEKKEIEKSYQAILHVADQACQDFHGSLAIIVDTMTPSEKLPDQEQLENVVTVVQNVKSRLNHPETQRKITDARKKHNEEAFNSLLNLLCRQYTAIPQKFVHAVIDSWTNPYNDLIPACVKEHKTLFTKELQDKILNAALQIVNETNEKKINELLVELQKNISKDFLEGKITPSALVIQRAYPELFKYIKDREERKTSALSDDKLAQLKAQYNKIVNQAYLKNEIQKYKELQKSQLIQRSTESSLERILLNAIGAKKTDESKNSNLENLNILETLLLGDGLDVMSIEELKHQISLSQQAERLFSRGIAKNSISRFVEVIEEADKEYESALEKAKPLHNIIARLSPDVNPDRCKQSIEGLKRRKEKIIKQKIQREFSKKAGQENFVKQLRDFIDSASSKPSIKNTFEITPETFSSFSTKAEEAMSMIDFFNEYCSDMLMEFRQGADDPNEILGNGVCWAKSSRWVADEVNFPDQTITKEYIQKRDWNVITEQDRFLQAFADMAISFKSSLSSLDDLNKLYFPNSVRKPLNISPLKSIPYGIDVDAECSKLLTKPSLSPGDKQIVTDFWTNKINIFLENEYALKKSNGTFLLGIEKHAIYMRFDSKRNIYRIGDPNFGIFEFNRGTLDERKEKFIRCFAFFALFYKTDHCLFFQLEKN